MVFALRPSIRKCLYSGFLLGSELGWVIRLSSKLVVVCKKHTLSLVINHD